MYVIFTKFIQAPSYSCLIGLSNVYVRVESDAASKCSTDDELSFQHWSTSAPSIIGKERGLSYDDPDIHQRLLQVFP